MSAGLFDSYWLTPEEREEACEMMAHYNLIKWDNKRQLPLSAGGFTDVYINLRDERDDPEATLAVANLFANPLDRFIRRGKINLFVEVASSMSGIAGVLSVLTGLPRVTIREIPKEGRVSKANSIGHPGYGKVCWGIDDVTTSGTSLVRMYRECIGLGLQVPGAIVLVDRQQGWEKKFEAENIPLAVWPGMTLHHVRKWLINNGLMERCSPTVVGKNPIIVALDNKNWKEILPIIDPLRTTGCMFKVNDLLVDQGAGIISELAVYGDVLADLKIHDIPNTAVNIAQRLVSLPVKPWGVTVHGSGGREMIRAVVETLKGTGIKVIVVTVLTTFDKQACEEIYHKLPIEEVRILAKIGSEAGADGFVCSPEEVGELSTTYSGKIFVTPGVRSPGVAKGDQKRVGTPIGALEAGATHLVMGRQVTTNEDPPSEVLRVLKDELSVNI